MLRRKLINPLQIGGFVRHYIMIFLLVIREYHQQRGCIQTRFDYLV